VLISTYLCLQMQRRENDLQSFEKLKQVHYSFAYVLLRSKISPEAIFKLIDAFCSQSCFKIFEALDPCCSVFLLCSFFYRRLPFDIKIHGNSDNSDKS
jgi:hypothetical protein